LVHHNSGRKADAAFGQGGLGFFDRQAEERSSLPGVASKFQFDLAMIAFMPTIVSLLEDIATPRWRLPFPRACRRPAAAHSAGKPTTQMLATLQVDNFRVRHTGATHFVSQLTDSDAVLGCRLTRRRFRSHQAGDDIRSHNQAWSRPEPLRDRGGAGLMFNHGYWGASIGFYGGIDCGSGYFGSGYEGGPLGQRTFFLQYDVE
jgi:hypothetical protein